MTTVDNLPAQLPGEATDYFGSCLKPFLLDFVSIKFLLTIEAVIYHFINLAKYKP